MAVVRGAVEWIRSIADDDSHGYDQAHREGPDYDCSSLVIAAYKQAGIPLRCTYTGNMRADMLANGFADVTGEVNLLTGAGMQPGDVLLNEANHTAMYVGEGVLVRAGSNETGGITGGVPGDQTGREICRKPYYNYPWDVVLRYSERYTEKTEDDFYIHTVAAGETLWGISDEYYGDGALYGIISDANNLKNDFLYPGQQLIIPANQGASHEEPSADPSEWETGSAFVPFLRRGAVGMSVRALQALLRERGFTVSLDGDFGSETESAVKRLQTMNGLTPDGFVGSAVWEALIF